MISPEATPRRLKLNLKVLPPDLGSLESVTSPTKLRGVSPTKLHGGLHYESRGESPVQGQIFLEGIDLSNRIRQLNQQLG